MTARSNSEEAMLDQAVAWAAALESDDADWDGYMAWLEADPRHRAAFDSIALVSAAMDDHRAEITSLIAAHAPSKAGRRVSRLFAYAGVGIAAAIALILGVPLLWSPQSVQSYAADAHASRDIALANGIHVTLSPSSSITVRGKDAGQIELASGEAYFDVRHDPARSLTVSAGSYRISDIGTRFSVNFTGTAFRIGVADGTVSVASPGSEEVQISAGHQLLSGSNGLTLSSVASSDVGSWRQGRLSYSNAPLPLVAADISRYARKAVQIDPSLEKTHFSGTLVIGDGSKLLADLAILMGVEVHLQGNGARIGAAAPR
jgi:transmembrane sensor